MALPFDRTSIQNQLTGALNFINSNIRDTFPMFLTTKYIAPRAIFHRVGNKNYYPSQCATSEGATTLAISFFKAFEATGNAAWRSLAINVLDAYVFYFYLDNPYAASTSQGTNSPYCRNHWLLVAFGSVTTEGAQTGNDPFNFGTFTTANFTGGIAQLPTDTSRVFKVHSGNLLYQNLYAPVINGVNYAIDYWVANDGLKTYPDGRKLVTAEPIGTLRIFENFTGTLNVAIAQQNQVVVNAANSPLSGDGLIEQNPLLFPCVTPTRQYTNSAIDSQWLAHEAYMLAHKHTNLPKYFNAATITKLNVLKYVNLQPETFYYKKEFSSNPLRLPGVSLIQTNVGSNNQALPTSGYNASRQATGNKKDFLRLAVNVIATPPETSNPTMEVLQSLSQTIMDASTEIFIETEVNQDAKIKIKLCPDASDFSQEYTTAFPVSANSLVRRNFNYRRFLRPVAGTVWYPWIVNTPIQVSGGTTWFTTESVIQGQTETVVSVLIPSGTAACTLQGANYGRVIPVIWYSLLGRCTVRIKDVDGISYNLELNTTNGIWAKLETSWLRSFGINDRLITEIMFLGVSGAATLQLWQIGTQMEPMSIPSTVYRASLVCEVKSAYLWFIGDFKPVNNRMDKLRYTPGAVPFAINTFNGTSDPYRTVQFYMGYQSPYWLHQWGYTMESRNVIGMLNDAQEAYTNQSVSRFAGPLQQVFLPYSIENVPFLSKTTSGFSISSFPLPLFGNAVTSKFSESYQFDVFSWDGFDPNGRLAAYCYRAMEDLSRYYEINKNDVKAKKVLTNFIKFIWEWVQKKGLAPITDFPPGADPQANYPGPYEWALIGCCAIRCYVSKLEEGRSLELVNRAFLYLQDQYIVSGPMAGMWAKGQPDSVISGTTYKQFYSHWAAKIIQFLSECLAQETSLQDTPQATAVFPAISCNPNNVADYISSFSYDFPVIEHQFADGSTQQILLSRNPVGDTVELRFEAVNADRFYLFTQFYDRCKGGNVSFTFNTASLTYSELAGSWIFAEKPQISPSIQNRTYGLYDISIKVRRVE